MRLCFAALAFIVPFSAAALAETVSYIDNSTVYVTGAPQSLAVDVPKSGSEMLCAQQKPGHRKRAGVEDACHMVTKLPRMNTVT